MLKNTNLNLNILSYLKAKDFANLELVNHKLHTLTKKFPEKWKIECNKIFRSDYFNYSVLDEEALVNELPKESGNIAVSTDYKVLLLEGVSAINEWDIFIKASLHDKFTSKNFIEDTENIKNELLSIFKGKLYCLL